jgi:hypothetical protein
MSSFWITKCRNLDSDSYSSAENTKFGLSSAEDTDTEDSVEENVRPGMPKSKGLDCE